MSVEKMISMANPKTTKAIIKPRMICLPTGITFTFSAMKCDEI
jgi:hypothetical protein